MAGWSAVVGASYTTIEWNSEIAKVWKFDGMKQWKGVKVWSDENIVGASNTMTEVIPTTKHQ